VAGSVGGHVLCRGRHKFGSVQWGLSAIGGPVPASPAKLQCVTGMLMGPKPLNMSRMVHCQG